MSLESIVSVQISLETSAVSQAGFGTPMFISNHRRFSERVRGYPNMTAVAADFESTDAAYIAANAAFSQIPAPALVKLGRREATTIFTPAAETVGLTTTVTITVNDGDSVVATYVTGAAEDAEDICTDLAADINGDANVAAHVTASVVGSGSSAVLQIVTVGAGDYFVISDEANLTLSYTSSEAPADILTAIDTEDSDYYFIAAEDHTESFVLAMAAAVEARTNIYFVSTDEAGGLAAITDPATDILGKLDATNYFRTSGWFHHTADTDFPEMAFIAVAAPADAGKKVWGNNRIRGVAASADPATGKKLTYTQRNYLNERNANWIETVGGLDITRTGKVAGNEWIDVIRDRDYMVARLTENLQTKMINSPKIAYSNSGINEIRSVVNSTLNRMVSTETEPNILQETNPYVTTFPQANAVPFADKTNRVLNASFVAYLAGSIQITKITGTLTYDNEA